jgi:Flavin containing amine oxidoreductase.
MQVIPEQLMSKIDIERVMMEKTAINIDDGNKVIFDDGDIIKGENIILTGESTALAEKIKYEYNEVNTIYFTTENEIENGDYIHLFPEDDMINNIAIPSSISSAYSNGHSHLISITILEYDCSDVELIKKIRKRLSNYYGGEPGSYDFLRTFSISKGTIKQPVGHFERKKIVKNGLIIAGEQATNGSIEGAIISGLNAADQL